MARVMAMICVSDRERARGFYRDVLGPVLGGFITDNIGWSWIFLVNVPVSLFAGITVSF